MRPAVVSEGQAEVQAVVWVWCEAQVAAGTQQESTLAQDVLPGDQEGLGREILCVRQAQGAAASSPRVPCTKNVAAAATSQPPHLPQLTADL